MMSTEMVGPHNERRFPSKNCNLGKSGRKQDKKTENDNVIWLCDEGGLQEVEGESRTSW